MLFSQCINQQLPCFTQLVCSLIPSAAILLLGRKSAKNLRVRANFNPPGTTLTHSIKFLFCLALAALSIACAVVYALGSAQGEYDYVVKLSFYVMCFFNVVNWLIAMTLLRAEYKTLGYTSTYLLVFWWIAFLSKAIEVLITNIGTINPNGFDLLEVLELAYCAIAALLGVFSWIWVHDIKLVSKSQSTKNTSFRPNEGSILNNNISASLIHDREDPEISHATQRVEDIVIHAPRFGKGGAAEIGTANPVNAGSLESGAMDKSMESSLVTSSRKDSLVYHQKLLGETEQLKTPSNQENLPKTQEATPNVNEATSNTKENESNTKETSSPKPTIRFSKEVLENSRSGSLTSPKSGLLDKLDDVIDVRIKDYEYVWKDGKKSTVYVISFNTFFKSFEIQRGYSDFYKLYKKTMKAYPTIPLPPFPEKKGTTEAQAIETILDRRDRLNNIMRIMFEKKMFTSYLKKWINKIDDQSSEGTTSRSLSIDSNSPRFTSQLDVKDFFAVANEGQQEQRKTRRKSTERQSQPQPTTKRHGSWDEGADTQSSYLSVLEQPKGRKADATGAESLVIFKKTDRVKSAGVSSWEDFEVEVLSANVQVVNGEKATVYEVRVEDRSAKQTYELNKRYSEFKELQQELRWYGKTVGITVPELPVLGEIDSKNDQKLAEYQCLALKIYLQQMLLICVFTHSSSHNDTSHI